MEETFLSSVVLPLAIVIIMITMGMSLTVADFRRVLSQPKAVGVGLLCQLIVLGWCYNQWNAFNQLNARLFDGLNLIRIVGQQSDRLNF